MPCSGWVGGVWMVAVGKPAERMSERHHCAMAHACCCLHSASCPLLCCAACAPICALLKQPAQAENKEGETPLGAAARHGKMREALAAVATGKLDITDALQ